MKFGVFVRLTWIGSTDSSDLTASVSLSGRECVKTSGDVIKIDFNSASNGCISNLSPIPYRDIKLFISADACDVAGNAIETGEYEWQLCEF